MKCKRVKDPILKEITNGTIMKIILRIKLWFFMNRGYYMAARRYEISLRTIFVLKNISRVSLTREIFFNARREISYLQAAM